MPGVQHEDGDAYEWCEGEGGAEAEREGQAQALSHDLEVQLCFRQEVEDERTAELLRMKEGETRRVVAAHPDAEQTADSAIEIYFECGDSCTENDVMVELLAQLLEKAFFAQLRTVEQLGYIVGSGVATNHAAAALIFSVQSVKDPTELEARIETFLLNFYEHLQVLPGERLEVIKEGIKARKRQPDKSIERYPLVYKMN